MSTVPWTWSTTGFGLAGKSHESIIALCGKAGLAGIEGVAPLFEGKDETAVRKIADEYRAAGLKFDSFHLPFAPEDDISSFYETIRRKAVEKMARWMECAAWTGSRVVIQHPTTTRGPVETDGFDNYLGALGRSLETLLPLAEKLGLVIAIENMLPGPDGGRLGSRPQHFERFQREFGHRHLGFCLDTGHALVAGHERAHEFFSAMKPALAAFHLADNAGDRDSHLAPGHGRVDWDRFFQGMAEIGFAHVACIETPPFAYGPDYSPDAWREMVDGTQTLAEKSLAGKG